MSKFECPTTTVGISTEQVERSAFPTSKYNTNKPPQRLTRARLAIAGLMVTTTASCTTPSSVNPEVEKLDGSQTVILPNGQEVKEKDICPHIVWEDGKIAVLQMEEYGTKLGPGISLNQNCRYAEYTDQQLCMEHGADKNKEWMVASAMGSFGTYTNEGQTPRGVRKDGEVVCRVVNGADTWNVVLPASDVKYGFD